MPVDPSLVGREFPAPAPLDRHPGAGRRLRRSRRPPRLAAMIMPPTFPIVLAFDAMMAFLDAEGDRPAPHRPRRAALRLARPLRAVGDELTAKLTVTGLRQIGGADIIATASEITDAHGRGRVHRQGHPRPPLGGAS